MGGVSPAGGPLARPGNPQRESAELERLDQTVGELETAGSAEPGSGTWTLTAVLPTS